MHGRVSPSPPAEIAYRPDVDGLRTIAVGTVILFHGKLGVLPGGFVGVDVFFVISGFLISSILLGEIAYGRFSLAGFYERRIRRILPALMVVLLAVMIAGALLYPPQDYVLLAKSVKAAALFYANFFFHGQAGYFAPDAETQPLLHTWSLAVEEQFYLVAPLFLWGIARLQRRWQVALVAFFFVVSLGFSVAGAMNEDSGAFYLPHSRAFELMLGMMLAMGLFPRLANQATAETIGALGLLAIAIAVLFFSASTPFPGYAALLPCLGAVFIIASGASHTTAVSRLLATKPMVFTGKISYSLYLWHWPIFVFAEYQWGDLSIFDRVGLIVAAYLLSVLTYWFVEQPARQKTPFLTRRRIFAAGFAALVLAFGFSQLVVGTRGLPQRLGPEIAAFDEAVRKNKGVTPCPENEAWIASTSDCEIGAKGATERSFLFWGDSHARVLSSTVASLAAEKGIKGVVIFRGGCPPFLSLEGTVFDKRDCANTANQVETLLQGKDYANVVLVARWALYAEGGGYRNGKWFASPFDQGDVQKNHAAFATALSATVQAIRESGRTVTIVGPVPDLKLNPPETIIKAMMRGEKANVRATSADFLTRQGFVLSMLTLLEHAPGVRVVYPHQGLCDVNACRTVDGAMPLYTDDNHLGVNGVALIRRELGAAIAPAAKADVSEAR
jgi:peptidoglycan/LPS O-acetylase OafA/YrhL